MTAFGSGFLAKLAPETVAFQTGQRVNIWGDDVGTVIDGPHPDWNGCYRVAIDGDGLNYVTPAAMSLVEDSPAVTS